MESSNFELGKLPNGLLGALLDFLKPKEVLSLSSANKCLNEAGDMKDKKTKFMRLLVCVGFVLEDFASEYGLIGGLDKAVLRGYNGFISYEIGRLGLGLIDYETGEKLPDNVVNNISFGMRVLKDFADVFIGKNTAEYNRLVPYIKYALDGSFDFIQLEYSAQEYLAKNGILCDDWKEVKAKYEKIMKCEGINSVTDFYEAFFKAAGFTLNTIVRGLYFEKNCYKGDLKKQVQTIQNHKLMTGSSYGSIYNSLKEDSNTEKPKIENYIKAYEELKKE